MPSLNTHGFHLFLDHFAAVDPSSFHLLLLDNGAFHKARALRLPTKVVLLFFPPYAPELNPRARLWRELKDWLSHFSPQPLADLSRLLSDRLIAYSAATRCSLTGFPYLLSTLPQLPVQSS